MARCSIQFWMLINARYGTVTSPCLYFWPFGRSAVEVDVVLSLFVLEVSIPVILCGLNENAIPCFFSLSAN
jgi:hypothetical protein